MKLKSLFLSCLICSSLTLMGQTDDLPVLPKKWKISAFSLQLGVTDDIYQKMNLQTMRDLTNNPALLNRDLDGYTENLYRNSPGGMFGFDITLQSQRHDHSRFNHELRLSAYHINREPIISYNISSIDAYESIIYCNVVNEVNVGGAYLITKRNRKFNWFRSYAGIGLSMGTTYNNRSMIIESHYSEQEEYQTTTHDFAGNESLITRLQAPVGFEFIIAKHVSVGMEGNLGIGMQSIYGGKSYFLPLTAAGQLKVGWKF